MPDQNLKMCPLIVIAKQSTEGAWCKKELCEWWTENPETKAGRCALPMIEAMLREMVRQRD